MHSVLKAAFRNHMLLIKTGMLNKSVFILAFLWGFFFVAVAFVVFVYVFVLHLHLCSFILGFVVVVVVVAFVYVLHLHRCSFIFLYLDSKDFYVQLKLRTFRITDECT